MAELHLHPDRFLPTDPATRAIARQLLDAVEASPIISPHGHTDPRWFARDEPFEDAVSLLLWPDHYVLRMLYSRGIGLGELGLKAADAGPVETDRRKIWRLFAANYFLFRGTPSRIWLDHAFATVFGLEVSLDAQNADHYFDLINARLATPQFRPRALFEAFNIDALATTEGALDPLDHHSQIRDSGWKGRVITTFRPDDVVDPDREDFARNLDLLADLTGGETDTFEGYLAAIAQRRLYFREVGGATATDHGHPSARTADLDPGERRRLFDRVRKGGGKAEDAELFRAQMLTEMAAMSVEDGMVMQLHPGSYRNHNPWLFKHYGRDRGADIPRRVGFVEELKPLLDRFGNSSALKLILFTLDESAYARELAPLAGHYPALTLGPAWWFHDSAEGMMRYRRQTTETAGFYNTAGFNDDTRAFLSIPARHNLARRMDCAYLAELVASHRLSPSEAMETAIDLTYRLPKAAYRL